MYLGNIYCEQFLAKYDAKKAAEKSNVKNKSSNNQKSAFQFFFKTESKAF